MFVLPVRADADADRLLMERVAAGDARAFDVVYDRYHRRAHAHAVRIAGPGAADEVTQDAFLCLWRGAAKFDPARASLMGWLLALVHHRGIDWLRRAKARDRHNELDAEAEQVEAPHLTEDLVATRHEFQDARRLIAELPLEQRAVISLSYLGGYTHTQIAAQIGAPLGTVKGRMRLALEKLRRAAEQDGTPAVGILGR